MTAAWFGIAGVAVGAALAAGVLRRRTRRLEQLESSEHTRRLLLADVAHELLGPLTAIRGYAETLQLHDELDQETRRRYLVTVARECDRLERVIADLQELSRVEAGAGTFSPHPVPIRDVFETIHRRHERDVREKQLSVEIDVDPAGPEVWADPGRLDQALENLVSNAIRHTAEQGRIWLRTRVSADAVRIQVVDNGPGIDPGHLPQVFERFYKVESAAPSGGSGLGLSIVRAIAERHGGQAGVTSRPGETVFEIVLPTAPLGASSRSAPRRRS